MDKFISKCHPFSQDRNKIVVKSHFQKKEIKTEEVHSQPRDLIRVNAAPHIFAAPGLYKSVGLTKVSAWLL